MQRTWQLNFCFDFGRTKDLWHKLEILVSSRATIMVLYLILLPVWRSVLCFSAREGRELERVFSHRLCSLTRGQTVGEEGGIWDGVALSAGMHSVDGKVLPKDWRYGMFASTTTGSCVALPLDIVIYLRSTAILLPPLTLYSIHHTISPAPRVHPS